MLVCQEAGGKTKHVKYSEDNRNKYLSSIYLIGIEILEMLVAIVKVVSNV